MNIIQPNNVKRYAHTKNTMERDGLGMWVRVEDYWELKDAWIKQNQSIESAVMVLNKSQ